VKHRDLMDGNLSFPRVIAVPGVRVLHTAGCDRLRYTAQKTFLPEASAIVPRCGSFRYASHLLEPQRQSTSLVPTCLPRRPSSSPPRLSLRSTSTLPDSRSRPGRTIPAAQFMQPRPGRLVTGPSQHSLQSQGAGRHSSGSSPTTCAATTTAATYGCPERSFRPSPRFGVRHPAHWRSPPRSGSVAGFTHQEFPLSTSSPIGNLHLSAAECNCSGGCSDTR